MCETYIETIKKGQVNFTKLFGHADYHVRWLHNGRCVLRVDKKFKDGLQYQIIAKTEKRMPIEDHFYLSGFLVGMQLGCSLDLPI